MKRQLRIIASVLMGFLMINAAGCSHGPESNSHRFTDEQTGVYHSMEKKKSVANEYDGYLKDLSKLPISFSYEGKTYAGFDGSFKEVSRETTEEAKKTATRIVLEKNDLEVTLDMAVYPDHCAYEWTVYFTNKGKSAIGPISEVKAADITFSGKDPVIRGNTGDYNKRPGSEEETARYSPYTIDLSAQKVFEQIQPSGRSSEYCFPYYDLEFGNGGCFIAVGWVGSWFARFDNSSGNDKIEFTGGQAHLNTLLDPGETIRTPLMAFVFYEGRDENRAMNLWRHWFIDCNVPSVGGELVKPLTSATSATYINLAATKENNEVSFLNKYLDNGVPLDSWWLDAGWYYKSGTTSVKEWLEVGNWKIDKSRFPTEFKAISDITESRDMEFMVWFEPEIVRITNEYLDEDGLKPEWIIGADGTWRLADLGNPAVVDWIFERVSAIIESSGVTIYRQAYGHGNPLSYWLANDDEEHTGLTENKYVQGYLELWDRLLTRFPNIFIDTCASGGGRLDLETLRRSVPLHKTDYNYGDVDMKQSMHQALFQWIPYFGTVNTLNQQDFSRYFLRSSYCAFVADGHDARSKKFDWPALKASFEEVKTINSYYYCDYYPLTEWSYGSTQWKGWEFIDPETQSGFIQLFCPQDCNELVFSAKLFGLEADGLYQLIDADGLLSGMATGKQLTEEGYAICVSQPRTAVLITFSKTNN